MEYRMKRVEKGRELLCGSTHREMCCSYVQKEVWNVGFVLTIPQWYREIPRTIVQYYVIQYCLYSLYLCLYKSSKSRKTVQVDIHLLILLKGISDSLTLSIIMTVEWIDSIIKLLQFFVKPDLKYLNLFSNIVYSIIMNIHSLYQWKSNYIINIESIFIKDLFIKKKINNANKK